MKFDFAIGNPPYQEADGGAQASAKSVYPSFVEQAKEIASESVSMIMPARWYSGGKGLDSFRDSMLKDKRIGVLVDYFDATDCFPGQDISGGVCYFVWNKNEEGDCRVISHLNGKVTEMTRPLISEGDDTFIRFNQAVSILQKVRKFKEPLFFESISTRKPFGLDTKPDISYEPSSDRVKIYAYPKNGYIEREKITVNSDLIDKMKVCISYAYGERGNFPYFVIGKPFIAEAGSCLTETYLIVRSVSTKEEANNIISYMKTKFFRFLVLLKKNTQHATRTVYQYVPEQDYSRKWTDEALYKRYKLNEDEIQFIESMVKEME